MKYLSMHESRVREEIKTINGEECNVWCWIDVSVPQSCIVTYYVSGNWIITFDNREGYTFVAVGLRCDVIICIYFVYYS